MNRTLRIALALLAAVATLLDPRLASAHVSGLSRGEYTPRGAEVVADLVLRAEDVSLAVPGLDADGDGHLSGPELERARGALQASFVDALQVSGDGASCPGALGAAALDAPDAIALHATFSCARTPGHLKLRFGFLDRMAAGHRHLATVHLPGGDVDALCVRARPEVEVEAAGHASYGFASLARAGVEHILSGVDHLAFLVALVLGGTLVRARARARGEPLPPTVAPLVATLTAFTVGHSLSLGVATLGGIVPPVRFIEAAVALSVAYVGAENLFARSVRHRWAITLPFGCVHGFAFAGGLLPLGLPRAQLPSALVAFNLGVEAGQLVVLAALLLPLSLLSSRAWYPTLARVSSVAVLLAGLVWFAQRIA